MVYNGALAIRSHFDYTGMLEESTFRLRAALGGDRTDDLQRFARERRAFAYAKRMAIAAGLHVLELKGSRWVNCGDLRTLLFDIIASVKAHVERGGRADECILQFKCYVRSSEASAERAKGKFAAQTSTLASVAVYLAKQSGVRLMIDEFSEHGSVGRVAWSSREGPRDIVANLDRERVPGFVVVAAADVSRWLRVCDDADDFCKFGETVRARGGRLIALASESTASLLVGSVGGRAPVKNVAKTTQALVDHAGQVATRNAMSHRLLLHVVADGFNVGSAPMIKVLSGTVSAFLKGITTVGEAEDDCVAMLGSRATPPAHRHATEISDDGGDDYGDFASGRDSCEVQISTITYLARDFVRDTRATVLIVFPMFYGDSGINTALGNSGLPIIDQVIETLTSNEKRRVVLFLTSFDRLCREWAEVLRLMPFVDAKRLVITAAFTPQSVFVSLCDTVVKEVADATVAQTLVELMVPTMAASPSPEYLLLVNVYRKLSIDRCCIGGVLPLLLELNTRPRSNR